MLNEYSKVAEYVKRLRHNQTTTEMVFWQAVRNRKLDGYKFRRQFPIVYEVSEQTLFYIADFCCLECRLVVEIDGGVHQQQKERDSARTQVLSSLNFKVVRYSNDDVENKLKSVLDDLSLLLRGTLPLSGSRRGG